MPPNPDAFANLMPALMRTARRIAPSRTEAEDLLQEAVLKVWARMMSGAEVQDLRPYILATMRNIARRPGPVALTLTEDQLPGVPAQAPGRIATAEVLAAIRRLPAPQAQILTMLIAREHSYSEMAAALDLPVGTVMSRLYRARAALRAELNLTDGNAIAALLAMD